MTYDNLWLYKGEKFNESLVNDYYGFVYVLTNTVNNRKYIGKKFFWFRKQKQVKGKKKRYLAESDWRDYYGSSKELLADIEEVGKDNIIREIIHLCKNKTECAYMELKEQVDNEVLFSVEYYNNFIGAKIGGRNLLKENSK